MKSATEAGVDLAHISLSSSGASSCLVCSDFRGDPIKLLTMPKPNAAQTRMTTI